MQVNRLNSEGYYGGVRLLMAICKVFYAYCNDNGIKLRDDNFTLSYDTNIPRQVYKVLNIGRGPGFGFVVFIYIVDNWKSLVCSI